MTSTLAHDRSLRLFKFLTEFTQLKAKPQRTSDSYTVMWLSDVPKEPEIDNAARRESQDNAPDIWLSVRKPKLPAAPELPDALRPWVTARLDDNRTPPQPLKERLVTATVKDDDLRDVDIRDTLFFDQQPELLTLWEAYLGVWQRWAAGDRRARAVQDVYSRLFALHQNLSAFEETYELHLGLGYLSWKPQDKDEVRRHLLVARATLHFDALRGVLSVTAGPDGAQTALEQDMLERELRPPVEVQQAIERVLEDSGEDLWSAGIVPPLLATWVNALSASSSYSPDVQPPRGAGPQPTVTLAPALIMRKRGERSLTSAYREILSQVETQGEAPVNLAPFLGSSAASGNRGSDQAREPGKRPELYFPLPANDAQREIIDRLNRQPGVLVQGPPGTGKSHTIVNLVSHLLATNQRVLVTSHTARALKVLREKFPPELSALCVTYLRGEEGAKGTLERSVGELLQRANHRDERQERKHLDNLANKLELLRQEETQLLDTLRDFRKSETDTLAFFGYAGSAQMIAQSLRAQESEYDWLEELGQPHADAPLNEAEALRLLALLRSLVPEETRELAQALPTLDKLPDPEVFARAVHAEQQAGQREQGHQAARLHPHYALLSGASPPQHDQLIASLQALLAAARTAQRQANQWADEVVGAVLRGQVSKWRGVQAATVQALLNVKQLAARVKNQDVTGFEHHPPQTVLTDAQAVLAHLQAGGNWGSFFGKPAAVKERLYLREKVRVNGQAAATPEVLQRLIDELSLRQQVKDLEANWAAVGVTVSGPLALRLAQLTEESEALGRALELGVTLDAARAAVQAVPGLSEAQWWIETEVSALLDAVQAAASAQTAEVQRQVLEDLRPSLQGLLAGGSVHPVTQRLLDAIEQRHIDGYGLALLHARDLHQRRSELEQMSALLSRLRQTAPALALVLENSPTDPAWESRLTHLGAAWNWLRANAYLEELANPDAETEKRSRLEACRQGIRDTLKELAASKAWSSTLDRLTYAEQQALVRWEHAVKKLGKGTGKHAERWRKAARNALEEARSAIPAWIMPLHTVAETFGMSPGMFDVVIVDEASQAGPESLFLTFIAKKIIIVGDDKQIEPEGIGIVTERLDALVKQFLPDFPAPEVLGNAKASLFAFGAYSYPPATALREHFRCMPEIIAFSSRLSYAAQPLVALRQYGADRLEPLVARHIPSGFTHSNNVNPPEAQAIVAQIKTCIADPRYDGKTFGVISLLGDEQAEQIASLLRQELPEAELERRRLVCGNAYSFQGDERDVMFLSMVISRTEGRTTPKVSTDSAIFQPRYNVAASRARDQLWLFHSVTPADLHPEDLRSMLIKHVQEPDLGVQPPMRSKEVQALTEQAQRPGRRLGSHPAPFGSWFEVDVYLDIARRGYRVMPQVELAGYKIDLVVEGLRGRLAVECDGDFWHGPEQYEDDLHRQQILERAGMVFWRVRGSTYARDPEAALAGLWTALDERGVYPEGDPRNTLPVPAAHISTPATTVATPLTAPSPDESVTEPVVLLASPDELNLPEYQSWAERPLPDPRRVGSAPVIAGLREIVIAEGPLTARQAYQSYARASGLSYSKSLQSLLNRSVAQALREGVFVQADEWNTAGQVDKVLRLPDTPPVRLRQRGPRELSEIPPREIAELMFQLLLLEPELDTSDDPEALLRRVLGVYGAQRLTLKARTALEYAHGLMLSEVTT
ncbi:AAA domain-containing protein [Deinococcus sp.]|uniref:AAA domain-containing protein n=1 Tax=Deinococcus sp. TaxID=47478 RepID=UPI003B598E7C